jgi:type III secretion protein U
MSGQDGKSAGEKTEQPTGKRLRDARRDGDVPKSQDLGHTATTLVWTLVLLGYGGYAASRVRELLEFSWTQVDLAAPDAWRDVGGVAVRTLVELTIVPIGIVALCGVLVEFLQTRGVFAPKRIAPQASRLNPVEGFKRIFSSDNAFEIAKALAKTVMIATLVAFVIRHYLPDILAIPAAGIAAYAELDHRLLLALGACVVVLFAFVSIGDRLYQNYAHRKRLRMSKDEVRRERKEEHGDPQLRGQRRRLRRQWAGQNARQAARTATALVVNPTHIAIAILYEPEQTAIPLITAKGEGDLARLMRREAEDAGVPVVRDVPLARALNRRGEEDDFIPEEYFDAIAEVIAWAEKTRGATAQAPAG